MSGNCNVDYMACVSRPASGTKPCTRHSSNGDSIVPNVNGVYTHSVRRQGQQSWRSMWTTCSQPPPMTLRPHSSAQSLNPPGRSPHWVKRNSLLASQYGETERREPLCSARRHSSTKSSRYFTRLMPYQLLVRSLMYVASGTQPDIAFAVSKLSRFLNCYREVHWQAAVHVVRYLKGTRDLALQLGGASKILTPLGYSNSDYANDPGPQGRWSVRGYCFSLGSGMVSWSSKKQKTITDSTCAAEYVAVSEAGKELIWLRTLLTELGYKPEE